MEQLPEQVKNLLQDYKLGTAQIVGTQTNSSGCILIHVLDTGTAPWDTEYMTRFYNGMYGRITDELGPDVPVTVEIGSYTINAGIEGAEVNLFASSNNVMPSFVRHQFVLPVSIQQIPGHIQNDYFTLPHSTPVQIDKIVKILQSQRIVPSKLNHQFNLFKKGTMEVKTNENGLETTTVSYEFPDSAKLTFENKPGLNYKITGMISFPSLADHIRVHIVDCEDFKRKTEGIMDKRHLKTEFDRELLRAFEKHVALHKLRFEIGLPQIHQMIRITGCEELNRTEHAR